MAIPVTLALMASQVLQAQLVLQDHPAPAVHLVQPDQLETPALRDQLETPEQKVIQDSLELLVQQETQD